jgi:CheY-like chemotaxis protein
VKKVLDVGQCGPDHAAICRLIETNFQATVVQTQGPLDTLAELERGQFHLVLVNRKLDADYSDGVQIIRQIKSSPELAGIPVMLITNYPEHQKIAIEAGAVMGFGKVELSDPLTLEKLAKFLS